MMAALLHREPHETRDVFHRLDHLFDEWTRKLPMRSFELFDTPSLQTPFAGVWGRDELIGDDDRLHGMITDRYIVVRCLAEGRDPTTVTASELAQETIFWVQANADENDVLATMEEHQIRRLPVLEEHRLVGIISEADLARQLPADRIAEFTTRVYAAS